MKRIMNTTMKAIMLLSIAIVSVFSLVSAEPMVVIDEVVGPVANPPDGPSGPIIVVVAHADKAEPIQPVSQEESPSSSFISPVLQQPNIQSVGGSSLTVSELRLLLYPRRQYDFESRTWSYVPPLWGEKRNNLLFSWMAQRQRVGGTGLPGDMMFSKSGDV